MLFPCIKGIGLTKLLAKLSLRVPISTCEMEAIDSKQEV